MEKAGKHNKTNGLFNICKRKHYKTNGFLTFVSENTVKPMVFNICKRKLNKTNGFLTFLSENTVKPTVFHVFSVLDQTRPR